MHLTRPTLTKRVPFGAKSWYVVDVTKISNHACKSPLREGDLIIAYSRSLFVFCFACCLAYSYRNYEQITYQVLHRIAPDSCSLGDTPAIPSECVERGLN